ncbi:MAG: dTMP kinase [Candidatus Nanopelagicales bacterium]|nr:dTMP kinase [Candidatus Nanopelagicales bacterium]
MFIVLEGPDGSGKSTQTRLLVESLRAAGKTVVQSREPGGTPAAEAIRNLVLSPEFTGLDSRTEALLFAGARAEHVANVILPALQRGEVVVCDRYIDSSIAYQGIGRNLGVDRIRDLSLWATGGVVPDLTIVLDMDAAVGLTRVGNELDRLEQEPQGFHDRVRKAFVELALHAPERYRVVSASGSIEEVAARIRTAVEEFISGQQQ